MSTLFKGLLTCAVLSVAFAPDGQAATRVAANCSSAAVQSVINASADGDTVTLAEGGTLVIPDHGQHDDVHVAVRPSAIVVSTQPPQPSSARNTWQAKISGLTLLADRVRLDLDGQPPALVDVTPAAVAELSLDPGSQVWLTVKATDLEVYPHNGQ